MTSQTRINSYLESIAYQVQTLAPERIGHRESGKIKFDLDRIGDIRNLASRIANEFDDSEGAMQTIDKVIFNYGLDSYVSVFEALQRVDAAVYGCKKANRKLDLRKLELRLRDIFDGDFGTGISIDKPGISRKGFHPSEIADKRYHGGNYE